MAQLRLQAVFFGLQGRQLARVRPVTEQLRRQGLLSDQSAQLGHPVQPHARCIVHPVANAGVGQRQRVQHAGLALQQQLGGGARHRTACAGGKTERHPLVQFALLVLRRLQPFAFGADQQDTLKAAGTHRLRASQGALRRPDVAARPVHQRQVGQRGGDVRVRRAMAPTPQPQRLLHAVARGVVLAQVVVQQRMAVEQPGVLAAQAARVAQRQRLQVQRIGARRIVGQEAGECEVAQRAGQQLRVAAGQRTQQTDRALEHRDGRRVRRQPVAAQAFAQVDQQAGGVLRRGARRVEHPQQAGFGAVGISFFCVHIGQQAHRAQGLRRAGADAGFEQRDRARCDALGQAELALREGAAAELQQRGGDALLRCAGVIAAQPQQPIDHFFGQPRLAPLQQHIDQVDQRNLRAARRQRFQAQVGVDAAQQAGLRTCQLAASPVQQAEVAMHRGDVGTALRTQALQQFQGLDVQRLGAVVLAALRQHGGQVVGGKGTLCGRTGARRRPQRERSFEVMLGGFEFAVALVELAQVVVQFGQQRVVTRH